MRQMTFTKKDKIKYDTDPWEMLVVDDEEEVHSITKTVLKKFVFEDKPLKFYHAYTGQEAMQILAKNPNIALVLLDVVMESADAGLQVVKDIREKLNNTAIRIILRTGQPGSAPEKKVILTYDINDYKEKTELTSTKLYTSVITALRSYKELRVIQSHKSGLEQIINSNTIIFEQDSFTSLTKNILIQLENLLNTGKKDKINNQKICFIKYINNDFEILQSKGFDEAGNEILLDKNIKNLFIKSINSERHIFNNDDFVGYFKVEKDIVNLIYFNNYTKMSKLRKDLIEIFLSNIIVAIKNLYLHQQIVRNLDEQNKDLESKIKDAAIEMTKKDKFILQQSRLAQLGEMISMIAHQWRQPLNAIAASAIGIETKMMFWEENNSFSTKAGKKIIYDFLHDKLNKIEEYVQSLSMTIENFRDFYKPSKEKKSSTINGSIIQALDIVEPSMLTKSVTIIKEFNSEKELNLFNHELMQVFLNIFQNAQDSFDDKNIKNPIVNITTSDTTNGVRVDIFDNGGGIADEIKNEIFDPYFSTKDEKNGTGLGLYMSKMIIEDHHKGKIYFTNNNEGTCFTIEIFDNHSDES